SRDTTTTGRMRRPAKKRGPKSAAAGMMTGPIIRRTLGIGLLWLAAAAPSRAQGFREFGGGAPGAFDFYVLALSWSPGFCALEGERKGRDRCEPGRNLGFVVHGLWPQYERGYPSHCAADRSPSRLALAEAEGVFPDE